MSELHNIGPSDGDAADGSVIDVSETASQHLPHRTEYSQRHPLDIRVLDWCFKERPLEVPVVLG
jgi:hypothetical protein